MVIRNARPCDLDAVMDIESDSFPSPIREARGVFSERIKKYPEYFFVLTDEKEGAVCGCFCAERMESVPENAEQLALGHFPAGREDGNVVYISSFAVLSKYRGNGAGSFFWNGCMALLEKTRGVDTLVLLVNEEWKGARHIYKKSGFRTVRIFPSFFPSETERRADGILMQKDIR